MTQDRPAAAPSEADSAAPPGGAGAEAVAGAGLAAPAGLAGAGAPADAGLAGAGAPADAGPAGPGAPADAGPTVAGAPADPYAAARQSAARLAAETGQDRHDAAMILGSGWAPAADAVAAALGAAVTEVSVAKLGGFAAGSVAGHRGTVRSLTTPNLRLLVFLGRVHLYEGHPVSAVVHAVRTVASAGCRAVVLTNAAGGIRAGYRVGQPVLIRDHLNFTGASPLTGPAPPEPYPSRFTDLTALYSARLRALARGADPGLAEGVYAGLRGPHYETPAEIAMLRLLGADLVGMSTVLEAIAARHLGLEVLGISLVTNLAAGLTAQALDHREVVAAGAAATDRLGALLAHILPEVVSR